MKYRIPALLLAAFLLAGCTSRTAVTAEETPAPAESAEPSPSATPGPTPEPTATPTPTPSPSPTPVPRWLKGEETREYDIVTVEQAAEGYGALAAFLQSEECAEITASYGVEEIGEPLFVPAEGAVTEETEIPEGDSEEALILAADTFLVSSDWLQQVISAFEWKYGWRVEVYSAESEAAAKLIRSGTAGLAILSADAADTLQRASGMWKAHPYLSTSFADPE